MNYFGSNRCFMQHFFERFPLLNSIASETVLSSKGETPLSMEVSQSRDIKPAGGASLSLTARLLSCEELGPVAAEPTDTVKMVRQRFMNEAGLSNTISLIHNGMVLADSNILKEVGIADGEMLTAVVITSEDCYYIGIGRLNVRSEPEMAATVLGKLPSGTPMKLMHKDGDWARAIIPENAHNFWMPDCPTDETCWVRCMLYDMAISKLFCNQTATPCKLFTEISVEFWQKFRQIG